jgi:hypothetical protein
MHHHHKERPMTEEIRPGYTRVTEILSQWDRFGHIDQGVLKRKAMLGTKVHEAIANYYDGIPTKLEDKAEAYFQSFLKWDASKYMKIEETEKRYYCDEMKITGAIDALLMDERSKFLYLVDFKTSAVASPDIWRLQAAFYHYLVGKEKQYLDEKVFFVQLDKFGKEPKVFQFFCTKDIWDICLAAWKCHCYLKMKQERV